MDSNGCCVNHPVYIQRTKRRVTRAQRILSRKARGCRRQHIPLRRSVRYQAQRRLVARLKQKIKRQRQDFLHVQAMDLIKNHETIVAEQLDISRLIQLRRCTKAIYEAGWRTFLDFWNTRLSATDAYSSRSIRRTRLSDALLVAISCRQGSGCNCPTVNGSVRPVM